VKIKSSTKTSQVRWYGADTNEDLVVAALGKLGPLSVQMAATACGLTWRPTNDVLVKLCESGRVEKGRARFQDGKIVAAYRLVGK